ncbi:hypothetical protein AD953_05130 [Acetobacter malorum]|uniref:Uncharacterized protein n=1 Tax=Acetobacter malorum TaxID=178901 RepID=A0A149V9L8_9PROT|nr:hypothetical protein [Acetobacter malorum]KXV76806.1 hypothetical protein AD953_05130 [Acetobacter malorum]
MKEIEVLRRSSFGQRTAEEERARLKQYFVETEYWRQVFQGEIDIVYGPKGSGKSAIYSLISQSKDELFDRNILVVPGENPQGTPAFKGIGDDPPKNEHEFVNLWKLYILTLCGQSIKDYGITNKKCSLLLKSLEDANLISSNFTLAKALKYAFDYVKRWARPQAVEAELEIDPITGQPNVTGRIVFQEPSAQDARNGCISVDDLFRTASEALHESGYTIWVVLDRLDVAFADKPELEMNALRALFKFYLDTKSNNNISTKIFLRNDIWSSITEEGFREASHIERSINIEWSNEDLTNLVIQRALSNQAICEYYNVDKEEILGSFSSQEYFLTQIFPDQVETGPNKPKTFQWMITRTCDAAQSTMPRELIHFLNELKSVQIIRLERGRANLIGKKLFESAAFKEALPAVSKVRLEQTLYAEFPELKPYIEKLKEQKATQPLENLEILWDTDKDEALEIVNRLEKVGFFERMGGNKGTNWRVPFLYRPALNLVQGSADVSDATKKIDTDED